MQQTETLAISTILQLSEIGPTVHREVHHMKIIALERILQYSVELHHLVEKGMVETWQKSLTSYRIS